MNREYTNDIIFLLNNDGKFEYASPCSQRILGLSNQELIGKSFYSFIYEDDLEAIESQMKTLTHTKSSQPFVYRVLNKEGELLTIEGKAMPVHDEKGNIEKIFFLCRDITEIIEIEQTNRNEEKLQVLGEFAAGIAHEIRNPLTTIKGFIDMLRNTDDDKRETYINIAKREINHIEQIIAKFMILAKPQIQNKNKINLQHLVDEVIQYLSYRGYFDHVDLSFNVQETIDFFCEPFLIKEVFNNLLINAVEAKATKITINLKREKHHIHFEIIDNGIGIEEHRLKKIGEPFYSNKEKGIGLGLTIVNRIITEYKGKIEFHSKDGSGTMVFIQLPISP